MTMVVMRRSMGRRDNWFANADGWGVEMPVGARVIKAQWDGEGILLTTIEEVGGPLVDHPLILVRAQVGFDLLLGRRVGEHLASFVAPLGDGRTSIELHLFQDAPWPTSALEALAAKGTG